jgi:hypothetical protein
MITDVPRLRPHPCAIITSIPSNTDCAGGLLSHGVRRLTRDIEQKSVIRSPLPRAQRQLLRRQRPSHHHADNGDEIALPCMTRKEQCER